MNISSVLRYSALVISSAAMVVGIVIMTGLVTTIFPEQYRVIVGAVVFLYGAYRFVVTYYRGRERDDDE